MMLALISTAPFSRLPLHIRCFTEYAHAFLVASPSPHTDVSVILDLGGVAGSTGRRRESTLGATSQSGPIDVSDHEFRSSHWGKWCEIREAHLTCGLCEKKVDPSVRLRRDHRAEHRLTLISCSVLRSTAGMWPICCVPHRFLRRLRISCPNEVVALAATTRWTGERWSGDVTLEKKGPNKSKQRSKSNKHDSYKKAGVKRPLSPMAARPRPSANSAWKVPRNDRGGRSQADLS